MGYREAWEVSETGLIGFLGDNKKMMRRTWIFLIFILLCSLACIATLQTGKSIYLFYAVITPPILSIVNAARPRRGVHYAYFNRIMMAFGLMVLALLVIPFMSVYFGYIIKIDRSIILTIFFLWPVCLLGSFVLWYRLYFMPAVGDWRFVRRYPRMAYTAHRLKQFLESYAPYIPLIYVKGKLYIMVGYSLQAIRGMATIDEHGNFVKDEELAETIMRCHKLATNVLHLP